MTGSARIRTQASPYGSVCMRSHERILESGMFSYRQLLRQSDDLDDELDACKAVVMVLNCPLLPDSMQFKRKPEIV